MRMTLDERMDAMSYWLMREFPTPGPTRVRFVSHIPTIEEGASPQDKKLGDYAECWFSRGRCYVDVSRRRVRNHDDLIDTLMHEWAHLISAKAGALERRRTSYHDDEWGLAFGRIYRRYVEDHGFEEVREIVKHFRKAA